MKGVKRSVFALGLVCAATLEAALPEVTNVAIKSGNGLAEITYALANPPAVVTMDVETNGPSGWASIGLENVYGVAGNVSGDVNKIVSGASGRIRWAAYKTWADKKFADGGLRAVVTAHPLDDTPDYMVVDLSDGPDSADRIRYYVSTNSLPGGGLFANDAYRTTHLVLKKVVAKGIPWTMGEVNEFIPSSIYAHEKAHEVTLSNNYYLAVFPLTQRQGQCILGSQIKCSFPIDGDMRILDRLYFSQNGPYVRGTGYPDAPTEASVLGKLRKKTANAVDFDLPGDAQWEYAAKAGCGEGYWGRMDLPINLTTTNYAVDVNLPGRYLYSQATDWVRVDYGAYTLADWLQYRDSLGVENGIPIAGSYAPNAWGFYDMFGSVLEWCQDWFQDDISNLNGAINANGAQCLDGTTVERRVLRGGCWFAAAWACRPSNRGSGKQTYPGDCVEAGLRVYCRAGLK